MCIKNLKREIGEKEKGIEQVALKQISFNDGDYFPVSGFGMGKYQG